MYSVRAGTSPARPVPATRDAKSRRPQEMVSAPFALRTHVTIARGAAAARH
ncbi:hypothetical protein AB0L44_00135 [Nonomuraea wenchangensis]|uniref:hypothetical protein n=1 Tax=Nonomuraea wenchangensis TaxID=568860 RepID=UPI0034217DAD